MICGVFQKRKPEMTFYGSEPGETLTTAEPPGTVPATRMVLPDE